jgi:cysteine desulfurase
LAGLRDGLEAALRRFVPEVVVFGAEAERLANTSAFGVEGENAETLLIALDLAGVAVSSGSACSSGKVGRSHVLAAMGVQPRLAKGALRVSLGWCTGDRDVEVFCEAFEKTVRSMRSRRAGRAA